MNYYETTNIYNTKKCTIWLDAFNKDSDVTELIKWRHIFHSEWLSSYYQSINCQIKKWPNCKTLIK